jgi:hypothetical protein
MTRVKKHLPFHYHRRVLEVVEMSEGLSLISTCSIWKEFVVRDRISNEISKAIVHFQSLTTKDK